MSRIPLSPRMYVSRVLAVRSPAQVLLHDYMLPDDLTFAQTARRIGITSAQLKDWMMNGKPMTLDLAKMFARAFNTTALYWMVLEARFELDGADM